MAWDALTHWDTKELATFLAMVATLSAVVVGIPTAMVAMEQGGGNKLRGLLLALHGVLLVAVPALLLVPMFEVRPRVAIIVGMVYVSMLMVRLIMGFPKKSADGLWLVLGPWLYGAAAAAMGSLLDGTISLFGVVDVLLEAGLVAFTAFWVAFPFFFFTRASARSQLRRFKANPPLYLFGLTFVFGLTGAGLWASYYAYVSTLHYPFVPGGISWLCTLLAILVQVGVDVRQQVLMYKEM